MISYIIIKNSLNKSKVLISGKQIKNFALKDLNDNSLNIKNIGNNKILGVNFFSLECNHCVSNLNLLNELQNSFDNSEIEIIAISTDNIKELKIYQKKNNLTIKLFHISETVFFDVLKETRVPVTFFLDKKFKIIIRKEGEINFDEGLLIINKFIGNTSYEMDRNKLAKLIGAEYFGDNEIVFQKNSNDCGPASLKMIFDYYKIESSLNEISNQILKVKGTSMLALKELAEHKGLVSEGWVLTFNDLIKINVPIILHVNNNHYVVFNRIYNGKIHLRDPSVGNIAISYKKFKKIWQGKAIKFKKKGFESSTLKLSRVTRRIKC